MKNAKNSNTDAGRTKLTLQTTKHSSKPQKFLLHMARTENNWAGRVTCLGSEDEYRFDGLEDLKRWLGAYVMNQTKEK